MPLPSWDDVEKSPSSLPSWEDVGSSPKKISPVVLPQKVTRKSPMEGMEEEFTSWMGALKKLPEQFDEKAEQAGEYVRKYTEKKGSPPEESAAWATLANMGVQLGAIPAAMKGVGFAGKGLGAVGSKISKGFDLLTGTTAREAAEAGRTRLVSESATQAEKQTSIAEAAQKHLQKTQGMSAERAAEVAISIDRTSNPSLQALGSEVAKTRPIEDIGSEMRAAVESNQAKIDEEIRLAKAELQSQYAPEVMKKEVSGQYIQGTPKFKTAISEIDSLAKKYASNKPVLAKIQAIKETLVGSGSHTPSFDAIDTSRQMIGASVYDKELAAPNLQNEMRSIHRSLTDAMKDYSGGFRSLLEKYPELSKPSETFEAGVPSGLLKKYGGFSGNEFYKLGDSEVAKKAFDTPEHYKQFVSAIGGDRAKAERIAENYFMGEVSGKTAVDAEKLIRDNQATFRAMPSVREALESKYIEPMRAYEKSAVEAAKVAKGRDEIASALVKKRGKTKSEADSLAKDLMAAKRHFDNPSDPEKVVGEGVRFVEGLRNKNLINDTEMKNYISDLEKIDSLKDSHEKASMTAREIAKMTAYVIGGGVTGVYAVKTISGN